MKYILIIILIALVNYQNKIHYDNVKTEQLDWVQKERLWLFKSQKYISMVNLCSKMNVHNIPKDILKKCLESSQNLANYN
jgi:hypothetical protein